MSKPVRIDISGKIIGYWTVLQLEVRQGEIPKWRCRCRCGTEKLVGSSNLLSGSSKSCGCRIREKGINSARRKYPRLYELWNAMKGRCFRPSFSGYAVCGGRGITICDEWLSFENFCTWAISAGYEDSRVLIRKDATVDFNPCNCVWGERFQDDARRALKSNSPDGEPWKEVALRHGVEAKIFRYRVCILNWPVEKAATTPVRHHKRRKILYYVGNQKN